MSIIASDAQAGLPPSFTNPIPPRTMATDDDSTLDLAALLSVSFHCVHHHYDVPFAAPAAFIVVTGAPMSLQPVVRGLRYARLTWMEKAADSVGTLCGCFLDRMQCHVSWQNAMV